jgi:rod shape-determining protein MreC
MINFLQKYWRTGAVILVIAGLLLLALSGYLAPVIKVLADPVVAAQRWLASRYYAVYQVVRSPGDVTALRTENEQLRTENSLLKSQVIQLQEQQKDYAVLNALLKMARTNPNSNYVAALVIGRDTNPFMRYILIDRGSDAGLRHGMPVITAEGLVGRIDAVTANAARVQLVIDPDSAVNVFLRDANANAMLLGSVTGDLSLEMIPQQTEVTAGDLILTSGLGGKYPGNLLVGQISSVRKLETALFQTASVQPAVDFTAIRAVLVVTDFTPVDLTPLTGEPGSP